MKNPPKNKLSAIEKTLEIMVAFADSDHELGTVEIGDMTGIHKATVSRILSTLTEYDMVSHNVETKKYKLGPMAYRLGVSQSSQAITSFVDISSGFIDELRDVIGESVSLEVWTEGKTVACYVAESQNPLRVAMAPADILPLHAPAGAKAILSHIPEESLCRLLPESLPSLTANTITSRVELLKRLREYNLQGYSVDNEELHPGIYALGVAVFDSVHKPVAAISAILPSSRISEIRETEIVQELKRAARKISKKVSENRPLFSEG